MTQELDGQTVVIAGASGGLGSVIAFAFARAGARLLLVGRDEQALNDVARSCSGAGAHAETATADVRHWCELEELLRESSARFGAIDVLVNATGVVSPIGLLGEVDPAEWADSVQVNLIGTFHLCRAVVPQMVDRRRGKIILFSGGGATVPFARFSAYAAAKTGVVRLAETLAEEVREFNVQVNAIAPGFVDTRIHDAVLSAGPKAGAQQQRVKDARASGAGAVPPDLAAELAVFLASTASGTLTGKLISAPHDPWREWANRSDDLNASPLYTLRRLDPYTMAMVAEAPV